MATESPKIYRVFIASPGDVAPERKIVFSVIDELNEDWEYIKYPARLELLSWEHDVPATAGLPQPEIEKWISIKDSDIFIAILWKRFGTPPLTNRPRDNRPYLSGTQQEIEEAYECWKHTSHPAFMLYRKDESVPSILSNEDINQLKLVNEFLHQFETAGEYPALIKYFKKGEFKALLKRELAQQIRALVDAAKSKPPGLEHGKNLPAESSKEAVSEDSAMNKWLKKVGLKDNPFRYQDAEYDTSLPIYFTRFPDLHAVNASDLTQERKTWFFFGKDGDGKTALRKFIAARARPYKPDADMICIEYDQVKFEHLLSNTDDLSDFPTSFVQSIYASISEYIGNEIQSPHPPSNLRGNLANLSVTLRGRGINWVLCLIDPGRDSFDWKGSKVLTSALITPLFSFSEIGGYGFRYFLPLSIKDELKTVFSRLPFNYLRVMEIKWNGSALKDMLSKRMTQLSVDLATAYRSLGQLCEDEQNLSSLIDSEIASLAQGNPRAAIWLANRLIELHCDNLPPPARITPETWNTVKMVWWTNGERRILGTSSFSAFRVLSDRIFFTSWEVILSERSDRLLKCLIGAKGGFRSKNELIAASWKDEKNLQGISEKALSEAIRRMKDELKKELSSKGFEYGNWIKSVRSRGYRLQQPDLNQEAQEGQNG